MLSLDSLTWTCPSVPLTLPCQALPTTTASSGNRAVPAKVVGSLLESPHLAVEDLLEVILGGGFFFSFAFKKKNKKQPEMSSDGKVKNNQAVVIYPPPSPPGRA